MFEFSGKCDIFRHIPDSRTSENNFTAKGKRMTKRTFTAILHKEGRYYVAECPETGTASQGTTVESAIKNLKEATEIYLEEFPLTSIRPPILTTFEVPIRA